MNIIKKIKKLTLKKIIDNFFKLFQNMYENEKKKLLVCGDRSVLYPTSSVENFSKDRSLIVVGENTHIRGQLLVFPNSGHIKVGSFCYIGENSRIWSMASIVIGNHVLISHGVNIHDNLSHSLSAASRREQISEIFSGSGHPQILTDVVRERIVIENDVWIGFNATLLKGVTIGQGAVVGACSIVTKDVAPYTVVAGNPARVIGKSSS